MDTSFLGDSVLIYMILMTGLRVTDENALEDPCNVEPQSLLKWCVLNLTLGKCDPVDVPDF